MAGCDVETCRTYLLYLSEDEAKYLAAMLQNDLIGSESESMLKARKSIWSALTNPLIKNNVLGGT